MRKREEIIEEAKRLGVAITAMASIGTLSQRRRKICMSILYKTSKNLVSYFGAKSKFSNWLESLMPKGKCKTYVEAFSGAMSVYFTLHLIEATEIVYADINRFMCHLVNCYRQPEQFRLEFERMMQPGQPLYFDPEKTTEERKLYFKDLYKKWLEELRPLFDTLDPHDVNLEIGVKYAFLISHAWNSGCPFGQSGFTYSETKKGTTKYHRVYERLLQPNFVAKAHLITRVEHISFEQVFEKYNRPDVFLYADPPYEGYQALYSSEDEEIFGVSGHERLAECARNFQGYFMLSYYNYEKLSAFYPKTQYNWLNNRFNSSASSRKGKNLKKGNEIVIMNYPKKEDQNEAEILSNHRDYLMSKAEKSRKSKSKVKYGFAEDFRYDVCKLREAGVSVKDISDQLQVSRSSVYRWCKKYSDLFPKVEPLNQDSFINSFDNQNNDVALAA